MSKNGVSYLVNIHEQDYTGSIVTLTGAAQPFITQEDDDDDIFMPIRGQSGYIRIVTDDSTLLDSIVPPNELSHLVTLTVDGVVKWRGFQETEMFEQEWYEGNHEVELPVRSLLASLESTYLKNDKRYDIHTLGELFYDLFSTFGIDLQFRCVWRLYNVANYFSLQLYSGIFFSDSSEDGELLDDRKYSDNGSDIAEALCKTFGIELRESEDTIYFLQHGVAPVGCTLSFNLAQMKNAATIQWYNILRFPTLSNLVNEWRGTENMESRLKPYKGIDITLDIMKSDDTVDLLRLEDIEEEDKPVYDMTLDTGVLHAQPYPQTPEEEMGNPDVQGYHYNYRISSLVLPEYIGSVRCAETVTHAPWVEPYDPESTDVYTGAIPCRWSFDAGNTDVSDISATEGYYLAVLPAFRDFIPQAHPRQMFVFQEFDYVTFNGGYIGINFNLTELIEGHYTLRAWIGKSELIGATCDIGLVVQVGDQYWNGSAWQSQQYYFYIRVENGAVKSNYDSTMNIAQTGGYLMPIGNVTGQVTISIMDHVGMPPSTDLPVGRAYFMSNFAVKYHKPSDATSLRSDRDKNKYISLTTAVGYNDVKDVQLSVGTNNYNRDSDTFLRRNGEYVETMQYLYGPYSSMTSKVKRPEEELLSVMKGYHSLSRRTYRAVIDPKAFNENNRRQGFPEIYPQIGSGTYMIIDANHDWRDDTQRVKFIELY